MLFVTQFAEVAALKMRLKRTRTDRTGISEYVDTVSGEKWIDFYQDVDGRMPPILRNADLPSDLGRLIDEALSSSREDDQYGLAAYFSQNGVSADELFAVLSRWRDKWPKRALEVFVSSLNLPDVRQVVGMTVEEVGSSYRHFLSLKKNIDEITHHA